MLTKRRTIPPSPPVTTSGSVAGTVTSSGEVETPAEICITNNGGVAVDGFTIKVNYEVT